eukprot:TRINITY_DN6579_c0_g1_i20.p1 TRINITY_DN6579_c0_g1~~TRINITY_DN6579_c0_g1_i20.p1  ORF type:complete len:207 (+),score=66.62 TRINITY_DN6579_c0_g1_i20:193-813(+)
MAAIESSYLITAVRSVTEFSDLRIPALNLAIEYLNALEGPLWKTIRGRGLSYNYYMYVSPDDGLMYFGLAKSSDIVAAYQEATKIVNNYANQVTPIDPLALQAAKSSLVFEVISEADTISAAAQQSFRNYLRAVPADHQLHVLAHIQQLDTDHVLQAFQEILRLFNAAQSHLVMTSNPANQEEILRGFQELQRPVRLYESVDHLFA